ncbi:MAG TPA: SRPBCC family protein [Candidatus Dormibacteraeota bacterium]
MGRITINDSIDAPVAVVFGYVDDHRNTTKYMQGLTKWKPTTSVTHGKGAKFEVAMKAGPTTLGSVVDITTWTENKAIAWRSTEGFKQTGKWAFKATGEESTDVTFEMEYEFGGGIAGRMLGRAAEPVVKSNLQRSVKTLKQNTERLAARKAPPKAAVKASAKSAAKPAAKAAATPRGGTARGAKR